MAYINTARKRITRSTGRRTLADTCVIDARTGGRVCTAPADGGVVPLPIQMIQYRDYPGPAQREPAPPVYVAPAQPMSSIDYYLATTSAAERARQDAILNAPRPGRTSRDTATIAPAPGPAQQVVTTAVASATDATTAANSLASILPTGVLDQLNASTWITGVPNWGVLIGGGALLWIFTKRKRR